MREQVEVARQAVRDFEVRWVRKKYRRVRGRGAFKREWQQVTAQYPRFFAHWVWTTAVPPSGDQGDKSRMNREVHVRICGSRRVRPLRPPDYRARALPLSKMAR